jgi:predicted porin
MRKTATALALALFAITASALEVGVTAGLNFKQADPSNFGGGCGFIVGPMTCTKGTNREEFGITVGDRGGPLGLKLGISRSSGGSPVTLPTDGPFKDNTQTRYSIGGSLDVVKLGTANIAITASETYLHNSRAANGVAANIGAEIRYPINKQVSLTANYDRQFGQSAVKQFDGNRVSAGVRYSF